MRARPAKSRLTTTASASRGWPIAEVAASSAAFRLGRDDHAALTFAHYVLGCVEDVLAQWAIVQMTDGKMSGDHLATNLNRLRAVMDGAP